MADRLKRYSRREILPILAGAAVGLITSPNLIEAKKYSPTSLQLDSLPEQGTVVRTPNDDFLVRKVRNYGLVLIPYFNRYIAYTEPERHGRKVIPDVSSDIIDRYKAVQEVVPPNRSTVKDPFTGYEKHLRRFGGKIPIFFGGFLTEDGKMPNQIDSSGKTFKSITDALAVFGWEEKDLLYFTYGEFGPNTYHAIDTARPPAENIQFARDYLEIMKQMFPLAQFDLIAHSLGGLYSLAALTDHYDAVDNAIFICSPLLGIKKTPEKEQQVRALKAYLRMQGIREEYVTDYLFSLPENQLYQQAVHNLLNLLAAQGRGIVSIFSDGDPVVGQEAAYIEGVNNMLVPVGSVSPLEPFTAHGRPLKEKTRSIPTITETVGLNLAGTT